MQSELPKLWDSQLTDFQHMNCIWYDYIPSNFLLYTFLTRTMLLFHYYHLIVISSRGKCVLKKPCLLTTVT